MQKGQSLVEILLSIAIVAVIFGTVVATISVGSRLSIESKTTQIASSLARQTIDSVGSIAESNWQNIYGLITKGSSSQYYPTASGTALIILSSPTTTIVEGRTFNYWFSVENVNRTSCGVGNTTTMATTTCNMETGDSYIAEDPSTQKITANVTWQPGNHSLTVVQDITRKRNLSFIQSDWSGGYNQENFPTSSIGTTVNNNFSTSTYIAYSSSTGQIFLSDFTVSSGTLISSVYDTFSTSSFNTITWQGLKPAGTDVKFKVAVSNSANGPWDYRGPQDSATSYYWPTDKNTPVALNPKFVNNNRYVRYKTFLFPDDVSHSTSSIIYDIIINWSP